VPPSREPTPRPVKYSDFAAKVSGRSSISGRKIESTMDRWLEARVAPPAGGMCSSPVICGRQRTCSSGPATTLDNWYCTQQLLECRSAWLLKDNRGHPVQTRAGSSSFTGRAADPAGHGPPAQPRGPRSVGADVLAGGPRGEAGRRGRGARLACALGLGCGSVVTAEQENELAAGARDLLHGRAGDLPFQQPGRGRLARVVLDHRLGDVLRVLLEHAGHVEALL